MKVKTAWQMPRLKNKRVYSRCKRKEMCVNEYKLQNKKWREKCISHKKKRRYLCKRLNKNIQKTLNGTKLQRDLAQPRETEGILGEDEIKAEKFTCHELL